MADRNRCFALTAIVLPLLFLALPGLARAATINVDTTSAGHVAGECTLEDAVKSANNQAAPSGSSCTAGSSNNDAIEFSVTGTITTAAMLEISDTQLAITGPAGGITIDGGSGHQIMIIDASTTVTLKDLTFAHGSTSGGGGAIGAGGTSLEVDDSTFSNNDAGEIGGAIATGAGTVTITNSTFTGNNGTLQGGGVGNTGSVLKITNCTFSGNEAAAGGALYTFAGTTDVKSTIFADSTGGNCGSAAVTNDEGYNLSDDTSGCFTATTSKNHVTDLNLNPLESNGGPTQTIALQGDSEAIDFIPVGDCTDQSSPTPVALTTDQRGFPRPDPGNPDFCDAGAYELQTTPFVLEPNSERLQIVHSSTPSGNQLNTAFTFIENGFPACDAADDAFNGVTIDLYGGSCAYLSVNHLEIITGPFTVQTVNHESYGTIFFAEPPVTLSIRMVELPTPAAPTCGEWTMNLELAGLALTPLGNGPFALVLSNSDGDRGCFDITNAIVGNQIPTPSHSVRRGVRRQTRR